MKREEIEKEIFNQNRFLFWVYSFAGLVYLGLATLPWIWQLSHFEAPPPIDLLLRTLRPLATGGCLLASRHFLKQAVLCHGRNLDLLDRSTKRITTKGKRKVHLVSDRKKIRSELHK
jgi:hypothetical protein